MFSTQHYVEIANVLYSIRLDSSDFGDWTDTVNAFTDMFAKDNPLFNSEKFETACGCN